MPRWAATAVFSQVKGLPVRPRQSIADNLMLMIRDYRIGHSNQSNTQPAHF